MKNMKHINDSAVDEIEIFHCNRTIYMNLSKIQDYCHVYEMTIIVNVFAGVHYEEIRLTTMTET